MPNTFQNKNAGDGQRFKVKCKVGQERENIIFKCFLVKITREDSKPFIRIKANG